MPSDAYIIFIASWPFQAAVEGAAAAQFRTSKAQALLPSGDGAGIVGGAAPAAPGIGPSDLDPVRCQTANDRWSSRITSGRCPYAFPFVKSLPCYLYTF